MKQAERIENIGVFNVYKFQACKMSGSKKKKKKKNLCSTYLTIAKFNILHCVLMAFLNFQLSPIYYIDFHDSGIIAYRMLS